MIHKRLLELTFHVRPLPRPSSTRNPKSRTRWPHQGGPAEHPHQQRDGGEYQEVHRAQEHRCGDPGQRVAEPQPSSANRSKVFGHQKPREHEQESKREHGLRHVGPPAPPHSATQCHERRADCEAEPTSLGGAQSSWNSRLQSPLSFHSGCRALSSSNDPRTR